MKRPSSARLRARALALAAGAALAFAGSLALAQQPLTQPPTQPPTPGMRLPGNHPAVPGMGGPAPGGPGRPPMVLGPDGRPMAPGRPPMVLGPDGRPMAPGRPGAGPPRPGRPGMPPGPPPRPRPHHVEAEEEHAGGGEHECPGHGPDDPPPDMNLWHGLLMVNNERAVQGGFVNKLLFRYENPQNPCDPKNEPAPYMASLINFGVLAFVLYRFGRKPLAEALAKRRHDIMGDIELSEELKRRATARLEDLEEKLENIDAKLVEVRGEYEAQAEVEKKHILAEAEERRLRMRRDAEFRIDQELKAMRDELLREAVIEATAAAEGLIQKQMTAADQDRMAVEFLRAVGPALNVRGNAGVRS